MRSGFISFLTRPGNPSGLAGVIGMLVLAGLAVPCASAQTVSRERGGYVVEIEHRLNVPRPGAELRIEDYTGDVELVGTADRWLVVTESIFVRSGDADSARRKASSAFSDVSQSRDDVEIRGSFAGGSGRSLRVEAARGMRIRVETLSGDVDVRGADSDAYVSTGSGDIDVSEMEASVSVSSGSGDITLSGVAGTLTAASGAGDLLVRDVMRSADLQTGAGDIDVSRVEERLEAATGGGTVSARHIGSDVRISTAGGDIDVSDIGGQAELGTSGGSISAENVAGDIEASTYGGDIQLTSVRGEIIAMTGAGDIDLRDVSLYVRATTEVGDISVSVGDAAFSGKASMEVRAENGDIELALPPTAQATVHADLGFGGDYDRSDFSRELNWTQIVEDRRNGRVRRVDARLNGGGGRIEIRTGSGSFRIAAVGRGRD